jgi:hypothetical protein
VDAANPASLARIHDIGDNGVTAPRVPDVVGFRTPSIAEDTIAGSDSEGPARLHERRQDYLFKCAADRVDSACMKRGSVCSYP